MKIKHPRLFARARADCAGILRSQDAIQLAAKIPPAREGSIEVRPVRELDPAVPEAVERWVRLYEAERHGRDEQGG